MAPRLLKQAGDQTSDWSADKMNITPKSPNGQSKKSHGIASSWQCYYPAALRRNNEEILRLRAELLEEKRSAESIELETVNHHLTLWFCAHPECQDEVNEYKAAQRYLDTVAGDDDMAATHLALTLAKDYFRSLFGHSWEDRR